MAKERIYRCTEAGVKALATKDPSFSEEHRRILGMIDGAHSDVLRTLLRQHSDFQRLAELEAKGLVAAEAAAEAHDLDFTGSYGYAKPA